MKGNEAITPREEDFAKWYTDVVRAARLADYSVVKGCMIYEPNGYAIWERIQAIADQKFKETGHVNVYMPLLIPESMLAKEEELVEGFAPEVAWVTQGGGKELNERLAIRPTSETLFGDYYSKRVQSHRDLPMLCNQWCNVMRWEMTSRPFLRSREFLWQEGHTAHATAEEAMAETKQMHEIYREIAENYLAIPVIAGRKTESEKFAGAEITLTVEALMHNGVSLQAGTSHYFGQKFAKAYDIKFTNENGEKEYAYTTSWGISTRLIGGLIMTHGDDRGLILPPRVAPVQVRIVPIVLEEEVLGACEGLLAKLREAGVRADVDKTDKSAGVKFAESEVAGVPLRIEIGKRDLAGGTVMAVRRDTGDKKSLKNDDELVGEVKVLLDEIQDNLYQRALARREELTTEAETAEEMLGRMKEKPGFVKALWCGDAKCEAELKEKGAIRSRCIVDESVSGKCVVCGKEAKHKVIWGIQY